ncbi:hypothetical protein PF001_g25600 [Phytophthora fragariae]|uniref:Protein root UVB sensitive/RUS domain-containing protein n=1 Tax=Phytophthora fragariae TaxID=53985 RepID=A0A6A4BQB6_9STRA|nr:hypothetical protein PF001_g25600 [Phytophthora fragariae]
MDRSLHVPHRHGLASGRVAFTNKQLGPRCIAKDTLKSVGLSVGGGDDKATPLAAALQWVLRDGSGMIGGLTFAYLG